MLLAAAIGIWQLAAVAESTHDMTQAPLAKERLISDWHSNINASVNRTTAIAKSSDPSLIAYFPSASAASVEQSAALQESIRKLLVSDEERKLFAGHTRRIAIPSISIRQALLQLLTSETLS